MRAALILLIGALILFFGVRKMKQSEEQLVLARTIYGEARGEGEAGMTAVANVVMNRVEAGGWFGDGVVAVCQKPWQFSAWNANDPNRAKIESMEAGDNSVFDLALDIAAAAIAGDLGDVTGGATHYHTRQITPSWSASLTVSSVLGNHIFYT